VEAFQNQELPMVAVTPVVASAIVRSFHRVMESRKNKYCSPRPHNGSPLPRSLPLAWKRTHGQCRKGPLVAQPTVVVSCFHSLFGTSPILCTHLWGPLDPHVEMSKGCPGQASLLWALLFLRHHGTENLNTTVTAHKHV
jgi:hypothetical protein